MEAVEIEELRKLEAAATKGPWHVTDRGSREDCDVDASGATESDQDLSGYYRGMFRRRADADFVAAARNATPLLLGELDQLRKETEELKKVLLASEMYRKAYQDGKFKLYSMGGEVSEAAMRCLPCGEGAIERFTDKLVEAKAAGFRSAYEWLVARVSALTGQDRDAIWTEMMKATFDRDVEIPSPERLMVQLEEARAIIDKLPKSKDGVPLTREDCYLWHPQHGKMLVDYMDEECFLDGNVLRSVPVGECYSTEAAAIKAWERENDPFLRAARVAANQSTPNS